MKKIITILITLCMILTAIPMTAHADAVTVTDLLSADKLTHKINSDNWTFNNDGTMTAPNRDLDDAAYMTDYKIEKGDHIYVEATAKFEGTAWGIIFAENNVNDPFGTGWFCLNIDTDMYSSRLFFINSLSNSGADYYPADKLGPHVYFSDARDGQYHTLGLEILSDGSMKMYLDGEMHTYLENANFQGATIGIMTCRANATYSSFTVQEGAPTHTTVRDTTPRELEYSATTDLLSSDVLKYTSGNGSFAFDNGKMTASRSGGDRAIISDIFVNPGDHVYIEATAKITDGNAWGIILAEKDKTNPFGTGWVCINASVDVFKTRIFCVNARCNVNNPEPYWFDSSIAGNTDITLGLEITPDGTFYLTCNGVRYAEQKATIWEGGYVGLMTWEAGAEFTSATYNVVSNVVIPCAHENTELFGKEGATIEKEGYTGDTVCSDCGEVLEYGTEIPKLDKPVETGDTAGVLALAAMIALVGVIIISKKRVRA